MRGSRPTCWAFGVDQPSLVKQLDMTDEIGPHWPQGWPPENALQVADALAPRPAWSAGLRGREDQDPSWLQVLRDALESIERERRLWLTAAFLELDPAAARSWLEQRGAELAEDERRALESVVNAADGATAELHVLFGRGQSSSTETQTPDWSKVLKDRILKSVEHRGALLARLPKPEAGSSGESS